MSEALKATMRRCGFVTENADGPLWFLVNEAEAAATAFLANSTRLTVKLDCHAIEVSELTPSSAKTSSSS